jgi:hypothetical protein
MDRSAFAREVASLTLGKRMPDGVYAHVEALPHLPGELQAAVAEARALAKLDGDAFHVVKFARAGWKLSLLAYPGFFDEPFPALSASWLVDLGARTVTARVYAAEGNPPILHRKETMLPPGHPRAARFSGDACDGVAVAYPAERHVSARSPSHTGTIDPRQVGAPSR